MGKILIPVLGLLFVASAAAVLYFTKPEKLPVSPQPAQQTETQPIQPMEGNPIAPNTQEPDGETDDWKTYTAEDGSYSFRYPDAFTQSPYTEGTYKGVQIIYLGPDQKRIQSSLADGAMIKTLLIHDAVKTARRMADESRRSEVAQPDLTVTATEIREVRLGDKTAYQYDASGMTDVTLTFVDMNRGILRIAGYTAGSTDAIENYTSSIQNILTTFRF